MFVRTLQAFIDAIDEGGDRFHILIGIDLKMHIQKLPRLEQFHMKQPGRPYAAVTPVVPDGSRKVRVHRCSPSAGSARNQILATVLMMFLSRRALTHTRVAAHSTTEGSHRLWTRNGATNERVVARRAPRDIRPRWAEAQTGDT
jgi:hypothetical protein